MAKMTGLGAMLRTISLVTQFATETPRKTSAPHMASANVRASVSAARASFCGFMPAVRPL